MVKKCPLFPQNHQIIKNDSDTKNEKNTPTYGGMGISSVANFNDIEDF